MLGCVLLGVGLGWQAVLSIAVGALVLGCLTALGSRWIRRGWQIPMLGILFAAALLHQIVWRVGVHQAAPWWPGPDSGIVHLLVPVGCLLLLGLAARRLRRLPNRVPDPGVPDPGMSDPAMSDLGDVSAEVGNGLDGRIPDGEP